MSQEIQEFIEKMKDWRENFSIEEYDYTKYDCEVADIMKMQKELNVEGLVDFWREKIKEEYFELKHPIYNEIILRAVYNYNRSGWGFNYVFMIDKNNKYPCFIIQQTSCINFFVTQDYFFIIDKGYESLGTSLGSFFSTQRDVDVSLLSFKDKKFGFTLEKVRPGHFYGESLLPLLMIGDIEKYIYNKKCFFTPTKYRHLATNSNNLVYLYPAIKSSLSKGWHLIFEDCISNMPITIFQENENYQTDLILWLGLPGQKRAWLEQIEGTALILKNLLPYFSNIKVYVDGMTTYEMQTEDFPEITENKILFDKVVRTTKEALKDTLVLDVDEFDGGGILKIHNL